MSTITPNTSLTTFGDITSDQDHLWPSFALSDDENELDRLQAKRRAIDAKIAQLERQQQMIMEDAEATPKAKANFETSTDGRKGNELFGKSLTLIVEELNKKIGQMAVQLNAEKQKEAGKHSKEIEKKVLLAKFAEMSQKIGQMEIQLKTMDLKEKNKYSQLKMENKELKINFGELRKKFERTERELQDMKQTVVRFAQFESANKKIIAKFPEIDKFFNVNTESQKKGANDGGEANVFGKQNDKNTKLSTRSINHLPLLVEGHWHRLILCNGMTCDGHNGFAWYFLLLHPDKADQIPSRPNTDLLKACGKILYSGLGRYPPSDVIKQINTKYGLNKSWKPNKK